MTLLGVELTPAWEIYESVCLDGGRDELTWGDAVSGFVKSVHLLVASQRDIGFQEFRSWVCVTEVKLHPQEPTGPWISFEVCVNIDRPTDCDRIRRFFFACSFQILGRETPRIAEKGADELAKWCLDVLLRRWGDRFRSPVGLDVDRILANTRMWIFGQSDRLYGYDAAGEIVLKNDKLPDPEVNYTDIRYLTGKWEEDWSEEDAEFDRLMAEAEAEKKLQGQGEGAEGPEKET